MAEPHPCLCRSPDAQLANGGALGNRAAHKAFPLIVRAARAGVPQCGPLTASEEAAQDSLVRLAPGPQAAEPDQRATVAWLREAAEDGVAAAQFKLGLCFGDGIGVERNEEAARGWYLRAAAHGHPAAWLRLERLPENS